MYSINRPCAKHCWTRSSATSSFGLQTSQSPRRSSPPPSKTKAALPAADTLSQPVSGVVAYVVAKHESRKGQHVAYSDRTSCPALTARLCPAPPGASQESGAACVPESILPLSDTTQTSPFSSCNRATGWYSFSSISNVSETPCALGRLHVGQRPKCPLHFTGG